MLSEIVSHQLAILSAGLQKGCANAIHIYDVLGCRITAGRIIIRRQNRYRMACS